MPVKSAPDRFALLNIPGFPVIIALVRFALVRLAPNRFPFVKFALDRSKPTKLVLVKLTLVKSTPAPTR